MTASTATTDYLELGPFIKFERRKIRSGSTNIEALPEKTVKIVITGLKDSGKRNLQRVIFQNLEPVSDDYETGKEAFSGGQSTSDKSLSPPIVQEELEEVEIVGKLQQGDSVYFRMWPLASMNTEIDDSEALCAFTATTTIIFLMDATTDPVESLSKLCSVILKARALGFLNLTYNVFLNKTERLDGDRRRDLKAELENRFFEELKLLCPECLPMVTFHMTSIFDYSMLQALGSVVSRQLPLRKPIEILLSDFCRATKAEKVFLMDAFTKIYLGTDSSPIDAATFQICNDFMDVTLDLSTIYNPDSSKLPGSGKSISRMTNGSVLYWERFGAHLAVVAVIREESFEWSGLVEHNVQVLKTALSQLFLL